MIDTENVVLKENSLAPIILFVYKRPLETKDTLEALKKNYLALKSHLFIFSDGPKSVSDAAKVEEVRKQIRQLKGFKQITIFESESNQGLANSVIKGVTSVMNQYDKVIVLEEDLVTSPNFLDFMNQALQFYASVNWAFSVSGYTPDLRSLKTFTKDFYLGYRASSWGWGTWKNRWDNIDWEIKDYKRFRFNILQQIRFMRGGSDMPKMLSNQMNKKIDSWAIRWCYNQFIKNMFTIFPGVSKVNHIALSDDATHVKNNRFFDSFLDKGEKNQFMFDDTLILDKRLIREFKNNFSVLQRIRRKLLK